MIQANHDSSHMWQLLTGYLVYCNSEISSQVHIYGNTCNSHKIIFLAVFDNQNWPRKRICLNWSDPSHESVWPVQHIIYLQIANFMLYSCRACWGDQNPYFVFPKLDIGCCLIVCANSIESGFLVQPYWSSSTMELITFPESNLLGQQHQTCPALAKPIIPI
jgi:hypothetical protein